ncbi:MAG: hypothetical protein NTY35_02395 [Planctomycetota bacterium]|nr:hypothetical protein [Planctomycetota bacterium]
MNTHTQFAACKSVVVAFAVSGLLHTAAAQQAQFIPIPGASATPGSNQNGCWISGSGGYSGVRVSADGGTVATLVFAPGFVNGAVPSFGAVWTEAGGTQVITPGLLGVGIGLYPCTGISADGSVVYGDTWRWRRTAGFEQIVTDFSRLIFGCSNDGGTVTGVQGIYPAEGDYYIWNLEGGSPQLLPRNAQFPEGYFYFNAISGDGRVVGGAARRSSTYTYSAAILTTAGSTLITGEASQNGVTDLSYDGSVAVGYLTDAGSGFALRAFRWTAATGAQPLSGTPGGSDSSYSRACDASGSVVVGEYLRFGFPGTRAFLWSQSLGFRDLQDELQSNYGLGSALIGWQLLVASDISADGRTIVGQARTPGGCEQAFCVRLPPDPAAPATICAGDGAAGAAPCPCGNNGTAGNGCGNSVNPAGARLAAIGQPRLAADSLQLLGSGMPDAPALYFQGTTQLGGGAGVAFGDGLRCAGGTIVRLRTRQNTGGSSIVPVVSEPPLSVMGTVPAGGGTRIYQVWYRNSAAFCTPSGFNLTNGITVIWTP